MYYVTKETINQYYVKYHFESTFGNTNGFGFQYVYHKEEVGPDIHHPTN